MAKKEANYNQKEMKELITALKEKEKELLETKMALAQRKIKDVHVARKTRKEIARIKTALAVKTLGI